MNSLYLTEKYWSTFFDISPSGFQYPKIWILPHAALKGYKGAWIFKANQATIISVPDNLVKEVNQKVIDYQSHEDFFSMSFVSYLFGDKVGKIIGPVFQGYYDKEFDEDISDSIRVLDWEKDQELILEIAQSGDATEWSHSSIDENSAAIYGYMYKGRCVAIANYKLKLDTAGFIGVYTHPAFRGKGLGGKVVKAAVKDISKKGYVALYQTLMKNAPSVGIASRLGIIQYAEHLAIRFTS